MPRRAVAGRSDDELGPQLLLAHFEVVEGDAAFGQVLVQGGELLEQAGLVDVVGRRAVGLIARGSPCPLCRARRSSILALARSFLAWSRCNFPNVERARATVHSFPAAGDDQTLLQAGRGALPFSSHSPQCEGLLGPERRRWDLNPRCP